jgi:type VI protein secretion system component Hcp
MTKRSKLNIVVTIATMFVLAAPCVAFAGKSGGGAPKGGSAPKSNMSLNYGKTETTYKPQKTDAKTSKSGRAKFNEFTIKKTTDKASP